MEKRELLTYKQMQEALPDYVFGRISEEDKKAFDNTLPQYPDISEEINQVRSVFSKVEKLDLNNDVSKRTRNMSVRVMNRMNKPPAYRNSYSFAMKYLIPSLGALVIGIFIFKNNYDLTINKTPENAKTTISIDSSEKKLIMPSEMAVLFDDSLDEEEIAVFNEDISQGLQINDLTDEDIAEYVNNETIDDLSDDGLNIGPDEVNIHKSSNFYELLDNLEKLDEEDFQKILKDLTNANIFS
jgi:hypothetical protein